MYSTPYRLQGMPRSFPRALVSTSNRGPGASLLHGEASLALKGDDSMVAVSANHQPSTGPEGPEGP